MPGKSTWLRILQQVLRPSGNPDEFVLPNIKSTVRIVVPIAETRKISFGIEAVRLGMVPLAAAQPGGQEVGTRVQTGDPDVVVLRTRLIGSGNSLVTFTVFLAWKEIVSIEVEELP
jgi:hypothetical protein